MATLNAAGLDISAQTYKADCPPVVLTKLPLIADDQVVDFVLARMKAALEDRSAPPPLGANCDEDRYPEGNQKPRVPRFLHPRRGPRAGAAWPHRARRAHAGLGSGYPDAAYAEAGATLVPTAADAWSAPSS